MTTLTPKTTTTTMRPAAARRTLASSTFAAAFMGAIVLLGLGMTLTGHWILLTSQGSSTGDVTQNWLQEGWRGAPNEAPMDPRNARQSIVFDDAPFDWNASQYTDRCLYVEDICHTAHRFYYDTSKSSSTSNGKRRHQPPLILDTLSSDDWPPNQRETVYRRYYRFRNPPDDDTTTALSQCTWSPITNHLVLFGTHNVMLGEFYDRSLVYLHLLYSHNDWVKSSQLYLHLFKPYRGLMDSHRVFTEPYRSWPLRSFADLWDEVQCECFSRLVMCGYSVETVNDTTGVGRYVPKRYRPGPMSGNYDHDAVDHGADTKDESATVLLVKPASWNNEVEYGSNATVRDVRNYIRSKLIADNPGVQTDIDRYRMWVHDGIYSSGNKAPSSSSAPSDFVLVGLAQRLGRRRWRNLDEVMGKVQARLKASDVALGKRIVMVEMNVEEDSSSYQQLVRHGALDGLIGIHGAQLTEAVWMKDGSWVIELLPYIPSYSNWGQWTRTVHKPTPLGEIFRGTELNHAGLRLAIASSPYCDGNESIKECWTDRYNLWDTRDFVVNADLLEGMVTTFFAMPHDKNKKEDPTCLCQDWQDRSAPDFVLYNVNCADSLDHNALVSPHAYYWPLEGAEPLNENEERNKRQH